MTLSDVLPVIGSDPRSRLSVPNPLNFLAAGVPLTLLIDLVAPFSSQTLIREERADTAWIANRVA